MATPIPRNEAAFSLEQLREGLGARLRPAGAPERVGRGVRIDSRRIRPGNLFVALVGERMDGHRFLAAARDAGAHAAVVERGHELPEGLVALEVEDSLVALGAIAAMHRRAWARPLIAITGSAAKTTTKELVAAALEGAGRSVLKTEGNLNNRIGLPMTLLCLDESRREAVIEMGTSEPGEIAALTQIAAPEIGLLTLVAAAHTAGLGSLEAVAAEKGALLAGLPPEGVAIACADDPRARAALEASPASRKLLYGRAPDSDLRVLEARLGADLRTDVRIQIRGEPAPRALRLGLLGEPAAINAAAALAVVLARAPEGLEAAIAALEAVPPPPGRMQAIEASEGRVILDDSYNANPLSTQVALETAAALARARGARLVVALGDMKELGAGSVEAHARILELAREQGAAHIVAVGPEMAEGLASLADVPAGSSWVPDAEGAVASLESLLAPGDVVLVKGSRSVGMERVVRAFVGDPRAEGEAR